MSSGASFEKVLKGKQQLRVSELCSPCCRAIVVQLVVDMSIVIGPVTVIGAYVHGIQGHQVKVKGTTQVCLTCFRQTNLQGPFFFWGGGFHHELAKLSRAYLWQDL